MTKSQRELAAELLDMVADQFSNHGCNDLPLDNTDDNWALYVECERFYEIDDEDIDERPVGDEKIYANDSMMMGYVAHLLRGGGWKES